ncbi:helix-turn-helix domain-containing protein [Streptococcus castoreus]|uniref:helix-turn-helix domain-containing protein n=1 Tax=Streptococcus castoreus TaxID=254786 RepID=UPI0004031E77|nr:helix-turn-helix domain-containing protein [Streptococcus castoreus]
MSEKSLGEVLREARVGKNITLDDIESKTGISSHYLLAMELDQFKIVPEEKFDQFLKEYADITELDFITLKRRYQYQINAKKDSETKSVTEIVEEKLSQKRLQERMAVERMNLSKASKGQETLVIPVKTVGLDLKTPSKIVSPVSHFKPVDRLVSKKSEVSRLSRYGNENKSKKSMFPVILLGLVASTIVIFVFFTAWKQFEKSQRSKEAEAALIEASKKASKVSKESSSKPKTKVTTEGSGNYLVASVTKSKSTVDVTVSLTEAESSWISLTNSEIGEGGITLTKESPSYTATLSAETTEALLTLGVTKGVSVTVDGEPVDLSALTSTDLSYITFKFQ